MTVSDRFSKENSWPHQFVKVGVSKEADNGDIIQEFICAHCNRRWIAGVDMRPYGKCPARNDKREIGRLGIQ
jgi:hypothetical protein